MWILERINGGSLDMTFGPEATLVTYIVYSAIAVLFASGYLRMCLAIVKVGSIGSFLQAVPVFAAVPSFLLLMLLSTHDVAHAAGPIFKCELEGRVTFQNTPCPSNEPRSQPDIHRLNAEARKRREAEAAKPVASPPAQAATPVPSKPTPSPVPITKSTDAFRCDGRKYCSQMTSCREATYFLKNCPGVKMDGDGDGIPCEVQWCGK